jgi:hypothetical protein
MEVTIKQIAEFYGVSYPTAIKRKEEIIKALDVKSKRVSIYHIAKYEGLTDQEVMFILKIVK